MESKFKIIIMDVDGTLTNSQKIVTPKTKAALMKAQELGIKLILASGRPTSGLIGLGHELQMDKYHGLFVCYNGSKVVDFHYNIRINHDIYPFVDRKSVV